MIIQNVRFLFQEIFMILSFIGILFQDKNRDEIR